MFTSATVKLTRSSLNQGDLDLSDILREAGIHRTHADSQTNMLFCQKQD